MRICAGNLSSLLEADLQAAGWNGAKDPYPDQTPRQAALASLNRNFLKKYLEGTSDRNPEGDAAALALFERVNESCRTFQLGTSERPSWVRTAIGEAKSFIYDFFYPTVSSSESDPWGSHESTLLTFWKISEGFNVGPGSSLGAPETDFYSKLALSNMATSSSALYSYYVQAIACNPTWSAMEVSRSKRFGCTIADSSRLSFVPKTAEISRTICTEPLLNMMFQKGIASILEGRLRQMLGINLSSQPDRNRRLARVGSLTGEFGTIDLSSASDSMSLTLVREFFPASVVRWLELTSCRSTVLPDGRKLELHMISSMGNAFTFPLQTILFASLVYGAYRSLGIPLKRPKQHTDGNFAVFGDDIIVVKEAYNLVCELLMVTGFSVNVNKSFNEGFFRESCGRDFFQGYDVRSVYLKRLRDASDCYSAINRLNRWSASHCVALPRTVSFLQRLCRYLPVPFDEDDSAGIKVPQRLLRGRVFRHRDTGGIIYRYVRLRKRSYSVRHLEGSLQVDRPSEYKPKGFYIEPNALLVSLLAGSIRDGLIGLRANVRKAVVKRGYSSRWDYIPSDRFERADFDVRWKSYVEINLD